MEDLSDIVGCSPLGIYCKKCRGAAFDGVYAKKHFREHIKQKHRSCYGTSAEFTHLLDAACASAGQLSIEDFLIGRLENGMECSFCRLVFCSRKKENFTKHLANKVGRECAEQKAFAVKIKYRPTKCGRLYAVERPVAIEDCVVPIQEQEVPVVQREREKKRKSLSLLERVCQPLEDREFSSSQMDMPDNEAAALMRVYTLPDESEEYYSTYFESIMGGSAENFECKLRQLVSLWSPAVDPTTEPDLKHFLEVGCKWFEENAYGQLKRLPANIRNKLVVFDTHEYAGGLSGGSFILRDFKRRLRDELTFLMMFAWRYDTTAFDSFKERFREMRNKGTSMDMMMLSAIFPRFLTALHLEKKTSPTSAPTTVVQFCLSRCFKAPGEDGGELVMVECGMVGTRFSDTLHLLRAGVLGTIVLYPTQSTDGDWMEVASELIGEARNCFFTNTISPMIADCRAMKAKKPKSLTTRLLENGDIRVDTMDFSISIIRKLIPRVHDRAINEFQWILQGEDWKKIPEAELIVEVVRSGRKTDFSWMTSDNVVFSCENIKLKPDIPALHWNRVAALVETIIHGFGGGAIRLTECDGLETPQVKYRHRSGRECYYYCYSRKQFHGAHMRRSAPTLVEHKVPPSLVWILLIYEVSAAQYFRQGRIGKFIQYASVVHYGVSDVVQEIFELLSKPTALQFRHLWAAVSNCVSPVNGIGLLKLSADDNMAALSHHTASTHSSHYATAVEGGEELLFRTIHDFMGEPLRTESALTKKPGANTPVQECRMLQALESLLGRGTRFLSESQERLLWLSCNNYTKNIHASTSCGGGKSMSWLLRPLALRLDGQEAGMSIVVLPYNFLSESQYYSAKTLFAGVRRDINFAILSPGDILPDSLPKCLQMERLPSIVFMSVCAMSNLLKHHVGFLREHARDHFVGRRLTHIFIDEVHTLLMDPTFMRSYDNLWTVSSIGCVVTTLSGSIPGPLIPVMARTLKLIANDEDDVKKWFELVEGGDPIGHNFRFDVKCTELDFTRLARHGLSEIEKFRKEFPHKSVHVIAISRGLAKFLHKQLQEKGVEASIVTSKSTKVERAQVAKEWKDGNIDVLCATTCSIYGIDAARCGFVLLVGMPYNAVNLIQGINRLRPNDRDFSGARVTLLANRNKAVTRKCQSEEMLTNLTAVGAIRNKEETKSFRKAFSLKALDNYCCKKPTCCRITGLCQLVGFQREVDCGACDYCDDANKENAEPVARQAEVSTTAMRQIDADMRMAEQLLAKLEVRCICRSGKYCDGYKNHFPPDSTTDHYCFVMWKHCTTCDSSEHLSDNCPHKEMKTLSGRACYHCCDQLREGEQHNEEVSGCRLGRRLRTMMMLHCRNTNQDFHGYSAQIHSSDENFAAGIQHLFRAVMFQKIVKRKRKNPSGSSQSNSGRTKPQKTKGT